MRVLLQIWRAVNEILANPTVQQIIKVNGIYSALERTWRVLKACRAFLTSIKEAVIGLWAFVLIFRSPQKYLVEALLPIAVRLACYSVLIGVLLFAAAQIPPRQISR